jgi:hypothetical protein
VISLAPHNAQRAWSVDLRDMIRSYTFAVRPAVE